MFRDRKPVDENCCEADTKPRGSVADAQFHRSAMWDIVGGPGALGSYAKLRLPSVAIPPLLEIDGSEGLSDLPN